MKSERKIYCLNKISEIGLKNFREGYTFTEDIEEAQGILVRSASMHDLAFPESLRAIARAGAGVNNIPLERCAEEGIVVFNTPGANANAVKELVLAALLLSSRDLIGGNEWVKDNKDNDNIAKDTESSKKAFAGNEIYGKTLGVIGLGAIGVLVANAAVSLGMKVYGYDPYMSVKSAWNLSPAVIQAKDTDEVYANSDFISVHVPLLEATKKMINKESIEKMKDGVKLINFSRDALVDEEALEEYLVSGKIGKYVTDFPNPINSKLSNTIILPHLGASTEEAEDNCAVMAVEEIQDYLDNGNITNSVNFPTIQAGVCDTAARISILHKNIPNMLSQITTFFGQNGLNIEHLANKSKDDYAYTLVDISKPMPSNTKEKLLEIEGVIRVRRIKGE